jgi:hypothetical protein
LPLITPTNAAAVTASQAQYGPKPLSVGATNYLQSASEILGAANWLLAQFGALTRRTQNLTVDAATYPAAWPYVLSANVGDVVEIYDQPLSGGPLSVGTYRISNISRKVAFGANGSEPTAHLTITADPLPSDYFT